MATNKLIGTLLLRIESDTKALRKGMNQTKRSVSGLKKHFSSMVPIIAAAFSVRVIGGFIKETIKLAGSAEGVRDAFEKLGDPELLGALRESTKNTVSDLELMKRAVMAKNFNIPIEQLASLFAFATKRAQQTGESVDYLVNSIVIGIGRKSPLILDNLGISAVRLREALDQAGHSGSTVMQVAAAVGKIAQQEMKTAGDIIDTTKIKTEQLQAAWDNLKVEIGTKFAPATHKALEFLNEILDKAFTDPKEMGLSAARIQLVEFRKTLKGLSKDAATSEIIGQITKFRTILQGVRVDLGTLDEEKLGKWKGFWNPEDKTEQQTQIGALEALMAKYSKLIKDYRGLLDNVDDLTKEGTPFKLFGAAPLPSVSPVTQWTPTSGLAESIGEEFPTMSKEYAASVARIEEANKNLQTSFQETGPFLIDYTKNVKEVSQELMLVNAVIAQSFQDLFVGIGTGLGEIATGGLENVFNNILEVIADFAVTFGSLLIAIGIGREALDELFKTGAPAVIAGIALVALGTAMKGLLSKGVMGGGATAGGGGGGGMSAIPITGTTKIRGRDIVIAYERGSSYTNAVT